MAILRATGPGDSRAAEVPGRLFGDGWIRERVLKVGVRREVRAARKLIQVED